MVVVTSTCPGKSLCMLLYTVRGLASSHVPNHMTGGWSSEALFKLQKKKAHVVLEVVSLRPSCYGVVHASAALLQGPDYSSPQGGARYSAKFCTLTKLISFTAIPSSKAMISVVPVKVGEQNHFL